MVCVVYRCKFVVVAQSPVNNSNNHENIKHPNTTNKLTIIAIVAITITIDSITEETCNNQQSTITYPVHTVTNNSNKQITIITAKQQHYKSVVVRHHH